MSNFLGSTGATPIVRFNDSRLLPKAYNGAGHFRPYLVPRQFDTDDGPAIDDYIVAWWPRSSGMLADGGVSDVLTQDLWEWNTEPTGASGRLGFVGITRDQYGSPLAACTVRCFRVTPMEMVSIVVSDANGAYIATTPYNDAHFLTVHGPAGVAGATVDTLVGG